MKYIIFSDVHSNLEALQEFIKINENKKINKMICLGDIIGYGASPSECLFLIMKNTEITLKGNHERMLIDIELRNYANSSARRAIEWTDEHLSQKEKEIIDGLPETSTIEKRFMAVHGSPLDPDEYILRANQALEVILFIKRKGLKLCFHGHTHLPGIFDENGRYFYDIGTIFNLSPEHSYLINPGSIGQPRDGDNRSSFCEFDSESLSIVFHRFDYDIDKSAEKIKMSGLPVELGDRLYLGR